MVIIGGKKLEEVTQQQMSERIHKHICAINWRDEFKYGKGSGIMISRDLVLTAANNFYDPSNRVDMRLFQVYPGQYGILKKPYKVKQIFIPEQFHLKPSPSNVQHDYALVQLEQKLSDDNYLHLGQLQNQQETTLAIFGYPDQKYLKTSKLTDQQAVNQWGLKQENAKIQLIKDKKEMIHSISTLPGQAGSPIILANNQKLSIIGIHKGSRKITINFQEKLYNRGVLVTKQMIEKLQNEAMKMGADMFNKKTQPIIKNPFPLIPALEQWQDIYTNEALCKDKNLYEVKMDQMKEIMHKNVAAIIWRTKLGCGKGSGLLLSSNLILTCAHNFFSDMVRVDNQCFQIYIGQSGPLINPYKIEKTYIPKAYFQFPNKNNSSNDYALIKLTAQVDSGDYIPLKDDYIICKQPIAIFGYPYYEKIDKKSDAEKASQWGLMRQDRVLEIREQKQLIVHCLSTLQGQSGSAIMLVENQNISVIGIHKGGIKTKLKGQQNPINVNVGVFLTPKLVDQLERQTTAMGANMFLRQKTNLQNLVYNSLATFLQKKNVRFMGIFISPNIILTAAHNFFEKEVMIDLKNISVFVGKGLNSLKKYRIQKSFIPESFLENPSLQNVKFDYALIKTAQKHNSKAFIGMIPGDLKHPKYLHCVGFPGKLYQQPQREDKMDLAQFLGQLKLTKEEVKEFNPNKNEIIYTKNARNIGGSPLFLIQNNTISIVGIHKGAIVTKFYKSQYKANCGRLITNQLIIELQNEIVRLSKQPLNISQSLISQFIKKGDQSIKAKLYSYALSCYENAIKLNPRSEQGHFGLGVASRMTNQVKSAIQSFSMVLKLNPKHFEALTELGLVLANVNQWPEAIKMFRKALKINPKSYVGYTHLSKALLETGQHEDAHLNIQIALSIDKGYAETYYVLGLILIKQKQASEAKEKLKRCLELDSAHQMCKELLKTLK